MRHEIDNALLKSLLPAVVQAEDMLARVDERAARSPVGEGFAERGHFFDAAGALWVAGELVHVEDLVLHDAHMDSRTPSHELTIAHAVLRARVGPSRRRVPPTRVLERHVARFAPCALEARLASSR